MAIRVQRSDSQASLIDLRSVSQVFHDIYFHLYTNSRVSRAESILGDLSLLLLCKIATEKQGTDELVKEYLSGSGTANTNLLPLLGDLKESPLWKSETFKLDDKSLRMALTELEGISLTASPAHVLGEAFQALIGPGIRGDKGQFFTPRSLVQAMTTILAVQPHEKILDPACGTGGFLAQANSGFSRSSDGRTPKIFGVDNDQGLARLSEALLSALAPGSARIGSFNSLDFDAWDREMGFNPEGQFDVVLTNPPFGAKIAVTDHNILRRYDLGSSWVQSSEGNWIQTRSVANVQDPQILFLEFCVRCLKPDGRLGIVLPEGLFGNKQTSYVWDWLETKGKIDALLDCPRTTFQPGTDTKTNVLFFTRTEFPQDRKARIAVALHCGHDRRGRDVSNSGSDHTDDFKPLAQSFSRFGSTSWQSVDLTGLRYLVPRYFVNAPPLDQNEKDVVLNARLTTLGELLAEGVISVRKGNEVGSEAYGTGEVPFVRTSDIANFEISTDPTKAVSEDIYLRYKKAQGLRTGDILMVVDGRYRIGATAILEEHNSRCVVQSHLRIISVRRHDLLDPYELLFALNLPSVRLKIRSLVFIQSTLGTLGSRLLELQIPLLHGDGPWRNRLDRFRETLRSRAEMLSTLKSMTAPEVEL